MFCKNCGTESRPDANYCFHCGNKISNEETNTTERPQTKVIPKVLEEEPKLKPKKITPGKTVSSHGKPGGFKIVKILRKIISTLIWILVFSPLILWLFLQLKGLELDSVPKLKNYYKIVSKDGRILPNSNFQVDGIIEEIRFNTENPVILLRNYKNEQIGINIAAINWEKLKIQEGQTIEQSEPSSFAQRFRIGSHICMNGEIMACGGRIGTCLNPSEIKILSY